MQFAHNGYYKGSTPLGLNLSSWASCLWQVVLIFSWIILYINNKNKRVIPPYKYNCLISRLLALPRTTRKK